MAKEPSQEYVNVIIDKRRYYRWSTGKYIGKLYKEAKDNKKLVTNRCPKCKEFLWPPQAVCGRCKVETGEDWVELSDKGTVIWYTLAVRPFLDPHQGIEWANPHPTACILLDNGVYFRQFFEEKDPKKLKVGMRVEAVWRGDDERGEETSDSLYFRTIEE